MLQASCIPNFLDVPASCIPIRFFFIFLPSPPTPQSTIHSAIPYGRAEWMADCGDLLWRQDSSTPPVVDADLQAALVTSFLRGALNTVDSRAVRVVRAMIWKMVKRPDNP